MIKIYNEITIDMHTGETLHEDSFMYEGDLDLCGGGGGKGGGGYTPPPPPKPLPVPEYVETEAEEPGAREEDRKKRRRGIAQGILTTPLGASGGGLGGSNV